MPEPIQVVPLTQQVPILLDVNGRPLPPSTRHADSRPFSAGEPLDPTLPGAAPRGYDVPWGSNAWFTQRGAGVRKLTAFEQLRALADYDMVRVAIEDVKGQVLGMSWDIQVREEWKDQAEQLEEKRQAAKRWLAMPDPLGGQEFRPWLAKVLEEVLVTDALALYPRFTRGGAAIGLEQVDGATIKPLVDDRGRPPLPPDPAYQQIIHGVPETEFTAQELWYLPRNPRVNSPYGRSPTEYVLLTINLALRQQLHDLAYYTSGNVPDSIYTLPGSWTIDKINEIQQWFDNVLAGRTDRRSGGLRFLPGGPDSALHPMKTREWKYEFQEWLGRVIFMAFGVSPIGIARVMNRATGEQLETSTMESGVRPIAEHIPGPINRFLAGPLESPEIEFVWGGDEVEDAAMVYARNVAYVNAGAKTLNEVRAETGRDPYPGEYGDRPFVMTASGPLFLDTIEEERQRRQEAAEALRQRLAGSGGPPKDGQPEPEPEPQDPDGEADDQAASDDLARWRKVAIRRAQAGKPQRGFVSKAIPVVTAIRLRAALGKVASPGRVREVFAKVETPLPSQQAGENLLTAIVLQWLDEVRPDLIAWAVSQLPPPEDAEKLRKEMVPDVPGLDALGLFSELVEALEGVATTGATDTIAALGIDLETPSASALAYARERAAELVGMKWINGELVANPNPEFAITETLRSQVRVKVTNAIDEGWSTDRLADELEGILGESRARTVARTETGFAYNAGAADVYEEAGVALLEILDGSGCTPDGHNEKAEKPTGTPGVVELDREANGQIWTVAQLRAHPLGHPNCVRSAVAAEGEA